MSQNTIGIFASQISGRLWEPQGAYDALSTVTVPSGGVASVTFAGIPTGYKHLQIRTWMAASAGDSLIQFNSDTTSNYSFHYLLGNGSSTAAGGFANQTSIGWKTPFSHGSAAILDILDYSNVSKFKTTRSLAGDDNNSSGAVVMQSGNWRSTSAISSIFIGLAGSNTFAQYSTFTLYGIR